MKASIVIRSHNEAPRLKLVLRSLEQQVGLGEVVVVDDGSTDTTPDVLAQASRRLPLTIIRHQEPQGRSATSNAGAAAASGDIVIFLDGDMLAGPGLVAAHLACHSGSDKMLIGRGEVWHLRCTRTLYDPDEGVPFPAQADRYARLNAAEQQAMKVTCEQIDQAFPAISSRAQKGVYPGVSPGVLHDAEMAALKNFPDCSVLWAAASGSNQSVRREMFLSAGGFDAAIDINEHRELALRLVLAGAQMAAVEQARVYHLIHRSGWRDPLVSTAWEELFWRRHPLPEVALLQVFWASLSAHPAILPALRIGTLPHLADIAHAHRSIMASSAEQCRGLMGYPERLA